MLDPDSHDMTEVQRGHLDRFGRLVARHQSSMFRYAQSKLCSRTLAEDAVQEAFLAVFQARANFDPKLNFRGWLWTILVNTCRRMGKRQARFERNRVAFLDHARSSNHSDDVDRSELDEKRRKLADLLDRLPAEQEDAIRLRFFGELRFAEIGQVMGCSESTVKSRVRYGLEKMSRQLGSEQEKSYENR